MTDLRAGLVEAMAQAAFIAYFGDDEDMAPFDLTEWRPVAAASLDAALGFLTDNAEAWTDVALETPRVNKGGPGEMARYFIAALSDSWDTGDSP